MEKRAESAVEARIAELLSGMPAGEQVTCLLNELKRVRTTLLRSDWHAAFEAALRMLTEKYGDSVRILVEEELGIEPPRADFIVLINDGEVKLRESIFRHFSKHNILEYKNPNDTLNESVLWKAYGYAGHYIWEQRAEAEEVTITLFRATRNGAMFERLKGRGQLTETDSSGVYEVTGLSGIRTRIIITDELKGKEYAACRALSDRPAEEDIRTLLNAEDETERARAHVILNLLAAKHPKVIEQIRKEKDMSDKWMEIFKDEIAEKVNEGWKTGRNEGQLYAYNNMVRDGDITIERAASKLGMTVEQFEAAVEKLMVVA